jgi:hypothetical protein
MPCDDLADHRRLSDEPTNTARQLHQGNDDDQLHQQAAQRVMQIAAQSVSKSGEGRLCRSGAHYCFFVRRCHAGRRTGGLRNYFLRADSLVNASVAAW